MTDGYNAAAEAYEQWLADSVVDTARARYEDAFAALLPAGAYVLELGCGGGGPTTRRLASRFALTGIDSSASQLALARRRVAGATFIEADMTQFESPPAAFPGVAAFYSLIHLPQGDLPAMFRRIALWLAEDGVLVASLGARGAGEHIEAEWLGGVPMYWSGYAVEDSLRFLRDAGLVVLETTVETNTEDGEPAPFLWVLARRAAQRVG